MQCAGPFAGKALSEARSEAVQLSPTSVASEAARFVSRTLV